MTDTPSFDPSSEDSYLELLPWKSRLDRVDRLVLDALAKRHLDTGVAQRTRIVARLLNGRRVSGQGLAQDLGISRAAVHKHMEYLRELGFVVESAPGSGYDLSHSGDGVVAEAVLPLLLARAGEDLEVGSPPLGLPGLPLRYVERVASTNELLRAEADQGAPAGTVAVTDYQYAGKGRLDRSWVVEPGKDLTFSLLLRPDMAPLELRHLVFGTAVAAAETLALLPGLAGRVKVKWPNDVLVDGMKVAGTLSETSVGMDAVHWIVVGLGVNVNSRPGYRARAERWPGRAFPPGSLREVLGRPLFRQHLLVLLLERITARAREVVDGRHSQVLADLRVLDALRGRRVKVSYGSNLNETTVEGEAVGIGSRGELLLRRDDGEVQRVEFGEAGLAGED